MFFKISFPFQCPPRTDWSVPLEGYYVGYKKMNSKSAFTLRTLKANACKESQEFVLHGLQKASSYLVIVKAFNHVGTGPPSEQVVVHTTDGGKCGI